MRTAWRPPTIGSTALTCFASSTSGTAAPIMRGTMSPTSAQRHWS
jgi:hypothetical protein